MQRIFFLVLMFGQDSAMYYTRQKISLRTLWNTLSKAGFRHRQEPITQSIQLPRVRVMAFSEVGLFLALSVFPVKISLSDDVHIKYTNFHKWNVSRALSDMNKFWCPYSLSACSYSINQILFLPKTRLPQCSAF